MSAPESEFLHTLFGSLHSQRVAYAIARDWENLPQSLGGSDLDILTGCEEDMRTVVRLAEKAAEQCNGRVLVKYQVELCAVSFGGRTDSGDWWGAHLDISVGNKYHGFFYFDPQSVIEGRVWDERGFYRVGFGVGVIAFMKELLANGKDRKNYYKMAREDFSASQASIEKAMLPYFGDAGFALVSDVLSNEFTPRQLANVHSKIYRALMFNFAKRHGMAALLGLKAGNYWRRICRILHPAGFFVAFAGTDGSGKSTVIGAIERPVYAMLHNKIVYRHLRPGLLPPLSRLMGKPHKEGPVMDPHSGTTPGTLLSLLRFCYYLLDYTLGYWVEIYPVIARHGCLVVCDRYYYEYLIDQRRLAVRLPLWLVKAARVLVPEPKTVFCLVGDPYEIHRRKPELAQDEVERQVNAWTAFAANEPRACLVTTTKDLRSTVDDVLLVLTERMSKR